MSFGFTFYNAALLLTEVNQLHQSVIRLVLSFFSPDAFRVYMV